jgi:hypothetical protein
VKEGNRRIAALKLIHGLLPHETLDPPDEIVSLAKGVTKEWRRQNEKVPCTIYPASDADTVDRIVTLAHGKGEKAGRDQWNAVARARHNRDVNAVSEPALDLLEKYLEHGRNVTPHQRERWAGDFPLSVLAEAMKRLAPRLGVASSPALSKSYPSVKLRDVLEAILHDIGQERLGFDGIRRKDLDFALAYGLPPLKVNSSAAGQGGRGTTPGSKAAASTAQTSSSKTTSHSKPPALAITEPKAVRRLLRDLVPRGKHREKVVTLKEEAVKLNLGDTPLAFCFVLRSMIEISAKAYCADHASTGGLSTTKAGGQEKPLVDILRAVTSHLTKGKTDKEMLKALHGAMTELARNEGLLSVTSMNQLVHNPRFSIAPRDIATLFGNVFPLLEAMNG